MQVFTVHVSRIANLFHFINNLSEWHFSCRKSYNQAWLAETGELSQSERLSLERFSSIVKRYPYGDRWLGKSFILADGDGDAWRRVSKAVKEEELSALHSIFAEMTPRFMRIWESDMPRMMAVKAKLEETLQLGSIDTALNVLSRFFNSAAQPMTIDLLLSRGEGTGGGANEAPDHVTLDVLEASDLRDAVDVVMHEISHNMEQPYSNDLYEKMSLNYGLKQIKGKMGWDAHSLIREAIIHTMFPGGCLSYLIGLPMRNHLMSARRLREDGNLRRAGIDTLTNALLPLVRSYIEDCRVVDSDFFEQAYHIYKGLSIDIG